MENENVQVLKKTYATPEITERSTMTFTQDQWEEVSNGEQAYQCFHCNCKG
ncbi:MAG: hypothetical protein LBP87_07525 [Planctomycetaceae bacterium]|jgi:hypothetical protein|nr:hypothetical protein [Planctomycetaceae bacterium]